MEERRIPEVRQILIDHHIDRISIWIRYLGGKPPNRQGTGGITPHGYGLCDKLGLSQSDCGVPNPEKRIGEHYENLQCFWVLLLPSSLVVFLSLLTILACLFCIRNFHRLKLHCGLQCDLPVQALLFSPPLWAPCPRAPLHRQIHLQYWTSRNILGNGFLMVNDVGINHIRPRLLYSLLQGQVESPPVG